MARMPTIQSLDADLKKALVNGRLRVSAIDSASQAIGPLLEIVPGLNELELSRATVVAAQADDTLLVTGCASLWDYDNVGLELTFGQAKGTLTCGFHADLPASATWQAPGLPNLSLGKPSLTLLTTGDGFIVGNVACVANAGTLTVPLALPLPVTDQGWFLHMTGLEVPLPAVSSLSSLLDGPEIADVVPDRLVQAGNLAISDFGLGFDPDTKTVFFVSATIKSSGKWEVAPETFAVQDVSISGLVSQPASKEQRSISCAVSGRLSIGDTDVMVIGETQAGDTRFSLLRGWLAPGSALKMSDLCALILPDVATPDLTIDDLTLELQPVEETYSLTAGVADTWTIPLGTKSLSVTGVKLAASLAKKGGRSEITGAIAGTTKIAGASLDIDWRLPGALKLAGTLPNTSLGDLIKDLLGKDLAGLGLTLPTGFTDALSFTEAQISISKQSDDYVFNLAATAGTLGPVVVAVVKNAGTWGFVAGFALPDDWKISDIGKALKSNPLSSLDDLKFSGLYLVLSSFSDSAFSLAGFGLPAGAKGVNQGLNVYGALQLEGAGLGKVGKLLNKKSLPVNAALGDDLASTQLQADLGEDFDLIPNQVVLKSFVLTLQPKPFSITVSSDADVTINEKALPEFSVAAGVSDEVFDLAFATKQPWLEPFGVKGLTVQKSAVLQLGMSPDLSLTVTGKAEVGGQTIAMACQLEAGGVPDMLAGSFTGSLTLQELVTGLIAVQNVTGLDGISLSDFSIYLVANPLGVTIAGKTYQPGIALAGALDFYGSSAQVDIAIDKTQGFSFAINEQIGSVAWDIQAAMQNAEFSASGSIGATVVASIGPIYVPSSDPKVKVKLADAISLDTQVSGSFDTEVKPTGMVATLGKITPLSFSWNGNNLNLGSLSITLGAQGLANLASQIETQIQNEADKIFGGLFQDVSNDAEKAGKLLNECFQQGAADIAATFKGIGRDAGDALVAVKSGTGKTNAEVAKLVKGAGYDAAQVGKGLTQAWNESPKDVANLLHGAGYDAAQVAGTLRNALGQSAQQTASFLQENYPKADVGKAMKSAGYAEHEISGALGKAGNTAAGAVKKAGHTISHGTRKAVHTVRKWLHF